MRGIEDICQITRLLYDVSRDEDERPSGGVAPLCLVLTSAPVPKSISDANGPHSQSHISVHALSVIPSNFLIY